MVLFILFPGFGESYKYWEYKIEKSNKKYKLKKLNFLQQLKKLVKFMFILQKYIITFIMILVLVQDGKTMLKYIVIYLKNHHKLH